MVDPEKSRLDVFIVINFKPHLMLLLTDDLAAVNNADCNLLGTQSSFGRRVAICSSDSDSLGHERCCCYWTISVHHLLFGASFSITSMNVGLQYC